MPKKIRTTAPKHSKPSRAEQSPAPQNTSDGQQPLPSPQQTDADRRKNNDSFPIVGIGASAGGLDALKGFFVNMPNDSGLAFVIVQHLDPTHKSIMGELLQKYTDMSIIEIDDGISIEPNCIYLNPPHKNIVMLHGIFQLLDPGNTHGINLPIDYFFRTLAEDRGKKAICIILSGTGSDGTLGLKVVKGAGGMVMVQEEQQAQYYGMPRSAVETGLADFILPVEQMPTALQKYVQHPYLDGPKTPEIVQLGLENYLYKIFALLRVQIGHDFSNYKDTTIRRRIERRMAVHRIETLAEYVRYLQKKPVEMQKLFKDLLIGVTNFFRDSEAFDALKNTILPALFVDRSATLPIRVWVPGCSTGEEAYSLAILMVEVMETLNAHYEIQIFASDIDSEAVETARNAIYPESIAADVSPERLSRFFSKEETTYILKKQIREMVVVAEQNLIKDPPFSKLDMVSCRNLLIYLKAGLQKKILPLFHYTLNPGGILFLGTSESIGEFSDLFVPLDQKVKIFQRKERLDDGGESYPVMPFFEMNAAFRGIQERATVHKVDMRRLVENIIIEEYAPPCVIIDAQHHILYFWGRTDKYLKTPVGEPVFDILSMARDGVQHHLRTAIRSAAKKKKTQRCEGARIKQNGNVHTVDLVVRPLSGKSFPTGAMLVIFYDRIETEVPPLKNKDTSGERALDPYIENLEVELQTTRESLQSTIEELETSNEELKSTNEELQSVNEELQSSNEELKTSKEELQSTNEELTTVNTELQHKLDELSRANDDINNLLASTDIGTIFLDTELHIQRFTPAMKKLFNLIHSDIGRPVGDITSSLDHSRLYDDAKEVLDTLVRKESEIRDTEGRWYSLRIAPYRTLDNIIDGVVMTFVDITTLKNAEEAQHNYRLYAENIVDAVRTPLIVLDADLVVHSANAAFYRVFQVRREDIQNKRFYDLGDRQWDIPKLHDLLENIIIHDTGFDGYEVENPFPVVGRKQILLNARRIEQSGKQPHLILLSFENISEV